MADRLTQSPSSSRMGVQSRTLGTRRKVLFAVICVTICAVMIDLILRIPGVAPAVYKPRRYEPGLPLAGVSANGLNSFNYQVNVTFCSRYDPKGDKRGYFGPDGRVEYRINSAGLRGPEFQIDKPPGVFRVVCYGDSFTFGEGVHEKDTYSARLEKLLVSPFPGQRVEVINAGVQAQGTTDELALFQMTADRFKPDVVTLGFFLNDATPYMETVRQHTERLEGFSLSFLGQWSKICEIVERWSWSRRHQEDFLITTRQSFQSPQWDACKLAFKTFVEDSRKLHCRFVVVIFPVLWQLDEHYPLLEIHEKIRAACHDAGCECVDLLEVYRGRDAESLWVHPTDQHPNEIAHRLAAETIAEHLKNAAK